MRRSLFLVVLISISFHSVSALKWNADTRLTFDSEISEAQNMVVDQSDRVHIVWRSNLRAGETLVYPDFDEKFEYGEIYYLQLDGGGKAVVGPIKVTDKDNSGGFYGPSIAVDANNAIHMTWDDWVDGSKGILNEVYYAKLNTRGDTIVGPSVVQSNSLYVSSLGIGPKGNLHLGLTSFSTDETGSFSTDIYYSKLDDSGIKMEGDGRLTIMQTSFDPVLAVDYDDNVHVVYNNWGDPDNEIHYSKLNKSGEILVNDIELIALNVTTFEPFSIGVDQENNLHLVFESRAQLSPPSIFYTKLDNNGNTLIDRIRITFSTELAISPKIAVDHDGNAHVVWQDERDGNSEIYYSKLNKNALQNITNVRLTNDSGISSAPDIAVDGEGNIHVVWADNRDGNFELYYKKGEPIDETGVTSGILSERRGGVITEIWTQAFEKLRDSGFDIYSYLVVLALIFLIIGLYKKKGKSKRKR